jgi:hypothetical protein
MNPACSLIPKDVPLQDYKQADQEHNDGNAVNGMHGPYVETGRSGWIFLPEEVSDNFVKLKELLQPVGFIGIAAMHQNIS